MTDSDSPLESSASLRGNTAHVAMIREAISVYRSGRTGIPYDTLVAFARPVLDHYGLDLDHCHNAAVNAANAGDMAVLIDVLESAMIFWSFFSAEAARETASFEHLKTSMLGPEPELTDDLRFNLLYDAMQHTFVALGGNTGDVLAWQPPPGLTEPSPADFFEENLFYEEDGPDQPESFALFAHPLYDNPDHLADPDALERITQLASAYWDLARLSAEEQPAVLDGLLDQFARTLAERKRLKLEARQMVKRYHDLFPG
ncbi:MAG: hypothetical protein SH809_20045 [Rhodothermales bacterium]|nr:hypothetical protein [Rhodothermales bacterium]